MITIRQAISQIDSRMKSTMDTRIAPKAIWNQYVFNLASILKQSNEVKRIYKSSDIWQKINCLAMTKVPAVDCLELAPLVNEYLAKSIEKLPHTYTSAAGDMIRDLNSTYPYGKQYRIVTPKEYKAIRKRKFVDPTFGYAFIIQDYLYIPDSEIEKVTITAAFINPKEVDILNGGDPCKPFLNYPFYAPEYLVKAVRDLVVADLVPREQIKKDEETDMNESNARGADQGNANSK